MFPARSKECHHLPDRPKAGDNQSKTKQDNHEGHQHVEEPDQQRESPNHEPKPHEQAENVGQSQLGRGVSEMIGGGGQIIVMDSSDTSGDAIPPGDPMAAHYRQMYGEMAALARAENDRLREREVPFGLA